jgi:hypothetical protein
MSSTAAPIDVFVSYAAADRERVRPLVDALVGDGLNVWWDRRISLGAGFDAEIQDALDHARSVLVVWSNDAIRSEWVINEANEGLERGVLVPVSIDAVRPPLAFRRRQTLDLTVAETPAADVIAAVRSVLEGRPLEIREAIRRVPRRWPWIAAGAVLGIAIGAVAGYWLSVPGDEPPPAQPVMRVPLDLAGWDDWKFGQPGSSLTLAPSGETVVHTAVDAMGNSVLVARRLDRMTLMRLGGTEGAEGPFFSPDGRWVGYFDGALLKRAPVEGGEPATIVPLGEAQFFGASWGDDDHIVYAAGRSGLKSVSLTGTAARDLTELDATRHEGSHRLPHHVAGHPVLLFSVHREIEHRTHEIWALNLETEQRRYLFDGLAPTYVASGHIVYAKGEGLDHGSLWAVPFDPERLAVTGTARAIQHGVGGREGSAYAVAYAGPLIYLPRPGSLRGALVLMEPGRAQRVLAEGMAFEAPRFSNGGEYLAATVYSEVRWRPSIWLYDVRSGAARRFAEDGEGPLWSPDDRSITFTRFGQGLFTQSLDGPAEPELLVRNAYFIFAQAWVRGGRTLLFTVSGPEVVADLYALDSGGDPPRMLVNGGAMASISKDEQWLATCTWPRGVLVGRYPDFSSVAVASRRGCVPKWNADDTRLYYQELDKLWAVDVQIGVGVALGEREMIADLGVPMRASYDVDRRGRIVIARHGHEDQKAPVLLLNWSGTLP